MPVIRAATSEDVPLIVALEAGSLGVDAWSAALVEQALDAPATSVWVAELATEFAGYAVVSVAADDADLQRIAVPAALRQQGWASLLLTHARRQAAAAGARRLLLEVRDDNTAARAFYAHHGFVELGRRARYYRDGATALVLCRDVTMEE